MPDPLRPPLPDGIVAVVKRDCPTCALVAPVLVALAGQVKLTVFVQDDPSFPEGVDSVDDTNLDVSWHHRIEAVFDQRLQRRRPQHGRLDLPQQSLTDDLRIRDCPCLDVGIEG